MPEFWLKVAGAVLVAAILTGAGTVIKHEAELSAIETDIQYIRESQQRIERDLAGVLGD